MPRFGGVKDGIKIFPTDSPSACFEFSSYV